MQTGSEQIKRQQEILKAKGFYKGKLDGIWGPSSIEAKKKWEVSGTFTPGLPSAGLPFSNKGPYPKGVTLDRKAGLLTCPELTFASDLASSSSTSKATSYVELSTDEDDTLAG